MPRPGPRSWHLTAPASPVRRSHALPLLLAPCHFRLLGEDSGAGQAAAFSAVGSITYSLNKHSLQPLWVQPPTPPPGCPGLARRRGPQCKLSSGILWVMDE